MSENLKMHDCISLSNISKKNNSDHNKVDLDINDAVTQYQVKLGRFEGK